MNELGVISPYGVHKKRELRMFNRDEHLLLIEAFDNVEKVIKSLKKNEWLHQEIDRIMMGFKDISGLMNRYTSEYVLDEVELFEVKNFAIHIEELIKLYNRLILQVAIEFRSMDEIIRLLNPEENVTSTFYIYDAYNAELKEIRQKKIEIEKRIFMEDNEVHIKTLKEKRLDLVVKEEKIESRIKKDLSQNIYDYVDGIKQNIDALGHLDLLIAKGRLAVKYCGIKPILDTEITADFREMNNPRFIKFLEDANKKYIPISIYLKKGVTVITGANMGGKSVTLKTLVLNLLLAHTGFFVFAKEARFSMMDFIYLISDDMQSVSRGLSSFGAEIIKINEAISHIKRNNGFIALDEFARGTNPQEAVSLIKALCEFLKEYNTVSVLSTHFDGVIDKDMKHYQVIGLKNVDSGMLKNLINKEKENTTRIIQDQMDYRLEVVGGDCGVPRDAIKVAQLLGLEDSIIKDAKNFDI